MTWNLLAYLLLAAGIAFVGLLLGVTVRDGIRARREADWPEALPRGPRSETTVQRGYAAHAADLWRIPVGSVTDDMRKAARRDLFMDAQGATRRERQLKLWNDFELPELPDDSVLYEEKAHG